MTDIISPTFREQTVILNLLICTRIVYVRLPRSPDDSHDIIFFWTYLNVIVYRTQANFFNDL